MHPSPWTVSCLVASAAVTAAAGLPDHPGRLTRTVSPEEAELFCARLNTPRLSVVTVGKSAGGRPIRLFRFASREAQPFRALFVGQQHGDEVSGKDALLCLIQELVAHPERCPADLDLAILPSLNPDGWASGRRTNDADADLNRDHLQLAQPETQALHRLARELRPHLVVDCHEFTRDSRDYVERGWLEWPLVTVDALNHPLVPASLRRRCLDLVEAAPAKLAREGFACSRYLVGGAPPLEELRPSTLEADDLRNALGSYGAQAFIIEAGIQRSHANPQQDLAPRASAVRAMLLHLLGDKESRSMDRKRVESARLAPVGKFIPVNQFWTRTDGDPPKVKVIALKDGRSLEVDAPNLMTQLSIKRQVPTPKAYLVDAAAAAHFISLLERHGLRFQRLANAESFLVEASRLRAFEDQADEVHQRYAGRTRVSLEPARPRVFPAGSLRIPVQQEFPLRVLQLLEPNQLYGLYQSREFRALTTDQTLPVWRECPALP